MRLIFVLVVITLCGNVFGFPSGPGHVDEITGPAHLATIDVSSGASSKMQALDDSTAGSSRWRSDLSDTSPWLRVVFNARRVLRRVTLFPSCQGDNTQCSKWRISFSDGHSTVVTRTCNGDDPGCPSQDIFTFHPIWSNFIQMSCLQRCATGGRIAIRELRVFARAITPITPANPDCDDVDPNCVNNAGDNPDCPPSGGPSFVNDVISRTYTCSGTRTQPCHVHCMKTPDDTECEEVVDDGTDTADLIAIRLDIEYAGRFQFATRCRPPYGCNGWHHKVYWFPDDVSLSSAINGNGHRVLCRKLKCCCGHRPTVAGTPGPPGPPGPVSGPGCCRLIQNEMDERGWRYACRRERDSTRVAPSWILGPDAPNHTQ